MKAIVTGSSGFVGGYLVPGLKKTGIKVVGIDRVCPRNAKPDEFINCDLCNLSAYGGVLSKDDVVFHLAAAKGDWGLLKIDYVKDNVTATEALLKSCDRAGTRKHIFFSTVAVYGPSKLPKDETSYFAPTIAYGRSKVDAERLYEKYIREHSDACIVVLRPSAIFGVNEPPSTNIYRLIEAIRNGHFLMVGDGSALKSTSYIENTIAATLFLLNNLNIGISNYIYVDEPILTTRQLVMMICQSLGIPEPAGKIPLSIAQPIAVVADVIGALTRIDFPITAARIKKFCTPTNFTSQKIKADGFVPSVRIEDAINRTVQWHVANV